MVTLKTFDSNIVSLLVLFIIYVDARNHLEVKFTLYNLFMNLVRLNMVLIVINLITWVVDGHFGFWNELFVDTSNLALFVLEPLASTLWIMYADYLVFHDENRILMLKKVLSIPIIINALLSVISLFTGWFF